MKKKPQKTKIASVHAVITAGAKVQAQARSRLNFSVQHLLAAAHFSRHVADIETAHTGEPFGAFFDEVVWFSSACILSCSAGLEAYANELFVDRSEHFPDLRPAIADKLWELFELKRTLEKFDMALLLKQKPLLDRGSPVVQNVAALIALRNGVMHFKPEWDNEQEEHANLSEKLKYKFAASPFLPGTESIFPRGWATHGCTRWAVKSCTDFLTGFESLAGVPARVTNFTPRLRG